VRGLGAERFISSDGPDAAQPPGELDVVIDTVGGAALDGSYALLREGGRLVTLSAPPTPAAQHKIQATTFVVAQDPGGLTKLAARASAGQLRTVISQTFPLAQGRHAFESGGHRRPPGKTVLIIRA
jgi:NADPH:quinone reductase-like Zn-dependent oxidoreductase